MNLGGSSPEPSQIPGTVLVVEDQAELRVAIADLLREEGFRVELAADGAQAAEAAGRVDPDVILMDLRLPGVDGLQAVREIKPLAPLAQVVVHSWYSDPATQRSLQDEGIYRFLAKGASSASIVEAVNEALAHKRAIEAGSSP